MLFLAEEIEKRLADFGGGHEVTTITRNCEAHASLGWPAAFACISLNANDQSRPLLRLQPAIVNAHLCFPATCDPGPRRPPEQAARTPPVIQHQSLLKRLAFGRNDDDVMFGVGPRIRFGPVEIERLQFLRVQPEQ